jgi:hypothetical protein
MTLDVNVSARYVKRERLVSWLPWPKVNKHFGVKKFADDLKVITSTQPKQLEYREGDILYVSYPRRLSSQEVANIQAQWNKEFWGGKPPCKLLIFDDGAQFGVLKKETPDPTTKCEN